MNKPELSGIWGLNNYFDKILADKKIAKHRLQVPTWFAILLEIKNDSLKSYGSIIKLRYKLNYTSDTLALFDSFRGNYALLKENDNLLLTQLPNQERIDSIKYIFSKRNDLRKLLKHQDSIYNFILDKNEKIDGIEKSITRYFNEKIISGTYTYNNKIVVFDKNGDLKNFDKFNKYEVRNYFGTLHPHKNLDVITLINSENDEYQQFNWKFENDKLILTEFVNEIIIDKEKKVVTDDFVLGKNKIELKIKNH
ncbi:hypothetical protein F7018_05395 [Tenacibaculum aiptasiae]|uniref:Uncharacterized protein n=1 Tax=Tenacibaculum aiptasiae TaxID=426481 RepID=A0A7J5AQQ1_9FLAO|nr:hypothetical protein [Tenacibaculum aiptasiae]KAB1159744.1 hypothetical protein F7018_05395 [Tenacibaculum aiptasiae]